MHKHPTPVSLGHANACALPQPGVQVTRQNDDNVLLSVSKASARLGNVLTTHTTYLHASLHSTNLP